MLYAYPMDNYGVGHYRVIWPLEAVADTVPYTLVAPGADGGISARIDPHKRPFQVVVPDDCEAVLMQRPTNEVLVACIPLIRALGIPVLVDVDDDLSSLSPRHPAFRHLHPSMSGNMPGHSISAVRDACLHADLVIASTPALLERYAPHKRGVLLRNRLRSDWETCLRDGFGRECGDPPPNSPRVSPPAHPRLGWPGALDSHPDDLLVMGNALARISHDLVPPPHRTFTIIGNAPAYTRSDRRLGWPVSFTGQVPFDEWLPALAHHLDIGVAPLEDTPFNRAKSAIKPLELAAAGVPVVRSTTPEYDKLDIGLPASTPKQWRSALTKLATDLDFRTELAAHDAQTARANTYQAHAQEWGDLFSAYVDKPREAKHNRKEAQT